MGLCIDSRLLQKETSLMIAEHTETNEYNRMLLEIILLLLFFLPEQ